MRNCTSAIADSTIVVSHYLLIDQVNWKIAQPADSHRHHRPFSSYGNPDGIRIIAFIVAQLAGTMLNVAIDNVGKSFDQLQILTAGCEM